MAKPEPFQVIVDALEILVVKLRADHLKEPGKSIGLELPAVCVGDGPQPSQQGHEPIKDLGRAVQHGVGGWQETAPDLPLPLDRLDGDGVDLPNNGRLLDAVAKHALPVDDLARVLEAGQYCL